MANAKKVTKAAAEQLDHLGTLETVSAQIRYLNSEGYSRGDIARILNIRYQWVRNVLITPLKKS